MTKTRAGLLATALLLLLPACGVPLDAAAESVSNRCSSDADCGGEGVCLDIAPGLTCVAMAGDLEGLIVEVRPGASARFGAGTSQLLSGLGDVSGDGSSGFILDRELRLEELIEVNPGKVVGSADIGLDPACFGINRSLPVKVELRPLAPYAGLPLETYKAQSDFIGGEHVFRLAVPRGQYDIHVEFAAQDGVGDGACALPPYFRPGQAIDESVKLNIEVGPPEHLTGTLTAPTDIEDWFLEMVEPTRGQLISTVQKIDQDPVSFSVAIDLAYYAFFDASPIVRLRPPEGEVAPRVHWPLDVVDLGGTGNVALSLASIETDTRSISGFVFDERGDAVASSLTVQSTKLDGAGANATYEVVVETDAETGAFVVGLLDGEYRVLARPKTDITKALVVQSWTINADDLGAGHDIEVPAKTILRGTLRTAIGDAVYGAPVLATPPLQKPVSYLDKALGLAPVLPDQAAGIADDSGAFLLPVDPGEFDLAVQPEPASGFPWFVRSQLLVPKTGADLGTLRMPYPVVMRGQVVDPQGLGLGDAVLRAWLPVVDADPENALGGTVIQVAEATTDAAGSYLLLLPPGITE